MPRGVGNWVKLVDRKPIDSAAVIVYNSMHTQPPIDGKYSMPKIDVGDVGQIISEANGNGCFEVQFPYCCIVCNDSMLEACGDPSNSAT